MALDMTSGSALGRRLVGMTERAMRIGADDHRLLLEEAMLDKTISQQMRMVDVTPQLHPAALRHPSILAECLRLTTAPAALLLEIPTTRANLTVQADLLLRALAPSASTRMIATTFLTTIHRLETPTAQKTRQRLGLRRRVQQDIERPLLLSLHRLGPLLLLLLTARQLCRLVGLEPPLEVVEATSARREGEEVSGEILEEAEVGLESRLSVEAVVHHSEDAVDRLLGLVWGAVRASKTTITLLRHLDQAVQVLLHPRGLEGPSHKRLHHHNRRSDLATIPPLPRTLVAHASRHLDNRSPNQAPLHLAAPQPQLVLGIPPHRLNHGRIQHYPTSPKLFQEGSEQSR
jgi:hypothetical protein